MSERAACACQRVVFNPINNADGTKTERWSCNLCRSEFQRVPTLPLFDRSLAFLLSGDLERVVSRLRDVAEQQEGIDVPLAHGIARWCLSLARGKGGGT